jgi:hypothetical protein
MSPKRVYGKPTSDGNFDRLFRPVLAMGVNMNWRFLILVVALIFASSGAKAEELRIGHLETADDTGINWLFFHCLRNGQVMDCSIFQTLIMHQLLPMDRAADVQKAMQNGTVKDFMEAFGEMCTNINQVMTTFRQAIQTGKGPDGRQIDIKQANAAKDRMPFFDAIAAACANPNLVTIRRVYETMADQKIKTCEAVNEFSQAQFRWNETTQSWINQEGPIGPCGRVNIGILERDKSSNSGFWLYTEKHITTNPTGEVPLIGSCSKFPDVTMHYTWRASENFEECRYITNKMN